MFTENIKTLGTLDIVLTDEHGNVKESFKVPNLVVTTGRNYITNRMRSNANAVMSHMAIGTNSEAAALGNVSLGTETARVAFTSNTILANTITYSASFPAGTPSTANAITEAGIFNASSGGEMLCRSVFSVVNKGTLDTLSITWSVSNS